MSKTGEYFLALMEKEHIEPTTFDDIQRMIDEVGQEEELQTINEELEAECGEGSD